MAYSFVTLLAAGRVATGQGPVKPLGYAQVTLSTTAQPLASIPAAAKMAVFSLETAAARYRDDGTPPTASIGMPVAAGTTFTYSGDLSAIQWIAQSGSPVLDIVYYG